MGLFKSLKKVLGGIGDAAKFVAPALNFVPGVGPLAAAGIGGLGGLVGELNDADGFNLGQGLGAGALSALSAYGAGKAKGALQGARGSAGAASAGGAPRRGLAGIGDALAGSSGGGWGNVAGDVLNFARRNPGMVLGGIGAVTGALGSARNDSREREALQALQADYEARRGLRDRAVAMIDQPIAPAPDLGYIFDDPGNPYRRLPRRA